MKLYATVTSERASKGQGGKEIEIKVQDEDKATIAIMRFTPDFLHFQMQQKGWITSQYNQIGQTFSFSSVKDTKGNKQKGECTHLITTAIYENKKLQGYRCNDCGVLEKVNPQYLKRT